ncbi:MAG: hypothetical protein AVDCRST_MAG12-3187, partial [uncultured Rubrobacteraceae bacterium]
APCGGGVAREPGDGGGDVAGGWGAGRGLPAGPVQALRGQGGVALGRRGGLLWPDGGGDVGCRRRGGGCLRAPRGNGRGICALRAGGPAPAPADVRPRGEGEPLPGGARGRRRGLPAVRRGRGRVPEGGRPAARRSRKAGGAHVRDRPRGRGPRPLRAHRGVQGAWGPAGPGSAAARQPEGPPGGWGRRPPV